MVAAQPKPNKEQLWIHEGNVAQHIPVIAGEAQYPAVVESEKRLLGTLLNAGEVGKSGDLFKLTQFLHKQDFFNQSDGLIWRAMERCSDEGIEITVTSVKNKLAAYHILGQVGEDYLLSLMAAGGNNVESFAHEVFQASISRLTMTVSLDLMRFGQQGMRLDITEFAQRLSEHLKPVLQRLSGFTQREQIDLISAAAHFDTVMNAGADYIPGMVTGYPHFDKITLGLAWKKLYLFAAPQGWGKTAWLLCLAIAMLRAKRRVKFNSLEMPREEIVERMMAIMAQIDYGSIRSRKLNSYEIGRLKKAREELMDNEASQYFVIQNFNMPTLADLDAALTDDQMRFAPDVQFLDYMGSDTISIPGKQDENSFATAMYTKLKSWKMGLGPAFVGAAQMNSLWDKKRDKRPGMLSIRYGAVAVNVADLLGYIYHPGKVKKNVATDDAEIIIQKNRCGPGGEKLKLMFKWTPECLTFSTTPLQTQAQAIEDEEA